MPRALSRAEIAHGASPKIDATVVPIGASLFPAWTLASGAYHGSRLRPKGLCGRESGRRVPLKRAGGSRTVQ